MKKTPLFEEHLALKGKMVEFAGYQMPVSYGQIKEEYDAVRNRVGLFDISHMAPIYIRGEAAEIISFIDQVTCKNIAEIARGQVQYNALVNEQGGLVDDITVYHVDANLYAIIANASNKEKVLKFLDKVKSENGSNVTIDAVEDYVLMALQGPGSEEILKKVFAAHNLPVADIYYYECSPLPLGDFPALLSRTGYTGEDGFELLLDIKKGSAVFKDLVSNGARPCGLASRDLLRLEVFYPLYGNELNETDTPFQSGIGWLVSKDKDYIGKEKVEATRQNPGHRVRGFIFEDEGVTRKDYKGYSSDNREIGSVTSGGFSFTWGKGFGMARIDAAYASKGTDIYVDIRGQKKKAEVLAKSPYQGSIKKR